MEELENRIEKAIMDIILSCFDNLVELFDSMPVRIARIIEKKIRNLPIKLWSKKF